VLVLSRQPGESVIIDGGITVQVLRVDGDTIKLGIEAPEKVTIYRKELYEEIQAENQSAGRTGDEELTRLSQSFRRAQGVAEQESEEQSAVENQI